MIKFDATATEIYDVISDVFGLEKTFYQLNQKQRELIEELANKLANPGSDSKQLESIIAGQQRRMKLLNDIHLITLKGTMKALKKARRVVKKNINECRQRGL